MTIVERRLRRPVARPPAPPWAVHGQLLQPPEALRDGDAIDRLRWVRAHFFSRNRRLFVNRFRNERRRTERFSKRSKEARGGARNVSGNTPKVPATSSSGFCLSAQCKAV